MTVEQSFLSYREHSDVRALGAVFDAVAQELVLIAAHIAPTGLDPEDLVQATFVEAMEHAARWDATRPLVPWLIGILGNQVRRERRRLQRTPPSRPGNGEAPDPRDIVELQETALRISEALRSLPRHYRQVLSLRLLHGLQPAQIAVALGSPVATCKTRLQRGMEMLRRALPAGIGATLATTLLAGKGLANCRQIVMAKAALHGAATTAVATSVVAGAVMKKTLAAVIAVAVLTTIVTLWPPGAQGPPQADNAANPATSNEVAVAPDKVLAQPLPVRTPVETEVLQPVGSSRKPVIAGSVVNENGQSVPDVLVALGRQSRGSEFADASMFLMYRSLNRSAAPRLPAERLTKSDADGRFTFAATLREQGSVLVAWDPQRGAAFLLLPEVNATESTNHEASDDRSGEFLLRLPDHATLFGRVVGEDAVPVPGAQVSVYPAKRGMELVVAYSDAEGFYRTVPLPPAAYRLRTSSRAHAHYQVTCELGSEDVRVDLSLSLLPVFSATLVDAQHAAWTGLRIENVCGIELSRLAVLATVESCSLRAEAARGGRNEERLDYDPQTGRVKGPIRNDQVAFLSLWHDQTRLAEVPLQNLKQEFVEVTLAALPMQTLRVLLTFDIHPAKPVRSKVRLDRPVGRLGGEFRTEVATTITGNEVSLSVPANELATSWWLSVEAEGYALMDEPLTWPAATPLLVREVRLVRTTRTLHGVVVDAHGETIEGAGVLVLAADGTFVGRLKNVLTSTDRFGAFRIEGLPERALRVLVESDDGEMAVADVPIDAAMPLRLVATAAQLLAVTGTDGQGALLRVLDREGRTLVDDRLRGAIRYGKSLQLRVVAGAHRIEAYLPCSPLPFARGDYSGDGDTCQLVPIAK